MRKKRFLSGIWISLLAALLAATPVMAAETGTAEETVITAEAASPSAEESFEEAGVPKEDNAAVKEGTAAEEDVAAGEAADGIEETGGEPETGDGAENDTESETGDGAENDTEPEAGEEKDPEPEAEPDGGIAVYASAAGSAKAAGDDAESAEEGSAGSDPEDRAEAEKDSAVKTTGFYQDPDSGDWYYYTDGKIDTAKNSVIKDTDKRISGTDDWWYVVGGKVQMNFTGLADYSNASGWWYITNGRVDRTVTTVAKNRNGWYYVKNGKVDRSYTGFATNANGSWYMESGKLTRTVNGVIKDAGGAIGAKNDWYYVIGSKVRYDFTGLANYSNASGWWYITKGKVDRTVTTVAKNKNGWYYVKNGKVDRSYTGFATNANGSWYMESGKLLRDRYTVIKDTKGAIGPKNEWYYVVGSKVRYDFTGLANYKNASGWWYITSGRVDRTYNGLATNKNGRYYVENGKVNQSYTGIAGSGSDWQYVKNGKVSSSTGDYSFAASTSQIIDVQASGSTGTLTLYNKSGNHFDKALSTSCYVGRNGITSNKSEGDGKTPSGVYTLGQAFGVASDPGSTRSYLKVNSNYYWVDDSTSRYYNQLVDVSKVSRDWSSAEHLIEYTSAYRYAIAVDYNTACTPYKGSAIFLHCSTGGPTSGCVAVSESYMVRILQSLKSDTRIYIH